MIIDVTGIELIPGNNGEDCPGNGEHKDKNGNYIECCCEACNYMICCFTSQSEKMCEECDDSECPRANLKWTTMVPLR